MQNKAQAVQEGPSGPLTGFQLSRRRQAAQSLSATQLTWASGYLAGLGAGLGAGLVAAPGVGLEAALDAATQSETAPVLTILYATQSGNARSIAEELASAATGRGFAPRVVSVDAYRVRELARERLLIVVISTQGEGEPPESARELFRLLDGKKPPKLDGLRYAVFGLGDSSYAFFCQAARDLDGLLRRQGARGLLQRVEADVDFQSVTADWYDRLLAEVEQLLPAAEAEIIQLPRQAPAAHRHDRNHPFTAELVHTRPITTAEAVAGTHHLSLAIDPQAFPYRAGDAVGIWFRNDPELVAEILHRTGLSGNEPLELQGRSQSLSEALSERLELTQLHPSVVAGWAERTGDAELAELAQDRDRLRAYAAERQFIDLLQAHPGPNFREASTPPAWPKCFARCSRVCSRSPRARQPTRTRSI